MPNSGETFVTVPTDEGIEPEVERKMKIQKMIIPDEREFERFIPASIQNQPQEIRAILTVIAPSFRFTDNAMTHTRDNKFDWWMERIVRWFRNSRPFAQFASKALLILTLAVLCGGCAHDFNHGLW
jgi:hypothetical protein